MERKRKPSENKLLNGLLADIVCTVVHLKTFPALVLVGMIFYGLCQAQPTQLGIDRNAGPARINVQGQTNRDYALFGTDQISTNWNFLATLSFSNNPAPTWFDSA